MKKLNVTDITWVVSMDADSEVQGLKKRLGLEGYEFYKSAFQEYLCDYFNGVRDCKKRQGKSINPLGGITANGGKKLKVRWITPGSGKSGGYRVGLLAYCERREVLLCLVSERKDEPSDEELEESFQDGDSKRAEERERQRDEDDEA